MSRFGRVTPSDGRDVIDRKACFLSLLAQAAVWLLELRVSQHFSTFYGSSVQAMDTQLDALPILPVLARGVSGCVNSAYFSTFYGSSVQSMDTPLNALPTLPVLARTVSGCLNSAFLDISQHFTGHLFSPWIPSSARGIDGGPRRFTEVVLNEQPLPVAWWSHHGRKWWHGNSGQWSVVSESGGSDE